MMRTSILLAAAVLTPMLYAGPAVARDYGIEAIDFTKVGFADEFWRSRMVTNAQETIPFAFGKCEETGRIDNFKAAAGMEGFEWTGDYGFNDSDVFKVIEGASYALMIEENQEMDDYLDKVIGYIAAAQEEDGYIYTAWTCQVKEKGLDPNCVYREERWDNLEMAHELYNLGHMYEAAAAHYLATGKSNFLDVATKSADLVCDVFGENGNPGVPGHQEIEIGLVKLHKVTGERKYLDQAKRFLDRRGKGEMKSEYSQSHKPVVEQEEAVGHAVRANYMYTAMADVAALTGNKDYIKAIDAIWDNVVSKKLHIIGGTGATGHGEAYGDNFELPNATAYCETCAAIANVYWNHRMFLLHGDAKYIDVMERSLYNNVLSGVSLDGKLFFYPNVLETAEGKERSPWFGCACCPSNITRFLASVPGYAYAVRDNELFVNMFVQGKAEFDVDGEKVEIEQKTNYPWVGSVEIEVDPGKDRVMTLKVRIPGWAREEPVPSNLYKFAEKNEAAPVLHVDGEKVSPKIENGYAVIRREWTAGDKVELMIPMPIRRVLCDERVDTNIGKAALQRGPLVYCIEWPDVEGGNVLTLMLEEDVKLSAEHKEKEGLGELTVIKGEVLEFVRRGEKGEKLDTLEREFEAIPYYAWAHRGKGQMAVWIPRTRESAQVP